MKNPKTKKNKLEGLYLQKKAETKKMREQRTVIVHDHPLYGQTPQALLRDPNILSSAKSLYALCHTYSERKELLHNPPLGVSQKILAEEMGVSRSTIFRLIKHLEEKGWVTVQRRGLGLTNIIILHGRKRRQR